MALLLRNTLRTYFDWVFVPVNKLFPSINRMSLHCGLIVAAIT